MPTPGVDYDIVIRRPNGSERGHMTAPGEEGTPRFTFDYLPTFNPREDSGEANYAQRPPDQELVLTIEDAIDGTGIVKARGNTIHSAVWSDGVDPRSPFEVSLGSLEERIETDAEPISGGSYSNGFNSGSNPFTVTAGAAQGVASVSGVAYEGAQSLSFNHANLGRTITYRLQIPNSGFIGGRINASFWVRSYSEDNSTVTAWAGISTSSSYSNSFGHNYSPGSGWNRIFISLDGYSPGQNIYLHLRTRANGTFGGNGLYLDDLVIDQALATLNSPFSSLKFAKFGSNVFLATLSRVYKDDGTFVDEPDNTDLIEFNGIMYLAKGDSTSYKFTSDGETWASSTLSGDLGRAELFARSRGVLWKMLNNKLYSSVDPSNSGVWSTAYTVGDSETTVVSVISFQDTILVGKVDGLFAYDRANDTFYTLTLEFQFSTSLDNFKHWVVNGSWLYLTTAYGLIRYNGQSIQSLRNQFLPKSLTEFGGAILALASDVEFVYILQDDARDNADQDKGVWLIALREGVTTENQIALIPYTLSRLPIVGTNTTIVSDGILHIGSTSRIQGASTYQTNWYTYRFPQQQLVPARSRNPNLRAVGTILWPSWDGGFPDIPKAFTKFTFENFKGSADQPITVLFKMDADPNDPIDEYTELGTIDSVGETILRFGDVSLSKRSGKRINFAYRLETDDSTLSPIGGTAIVRAILLPLQLRRFYTTFRTRSSRGAEEDLAQDPAELKTLLEQTYKNEKWPLILKEDFDGDGIVSEYNVTLENVRERVLQDSAGRPVEIVYDCEFWEADI